MDNVTDDNRQVIRSIYKYQQLDEITNRDANELLVRSNGAAFNSTVSTTPVCNQPVNNESL